MTTEVCRWQGSSEWACSAWKRTPGGLELSEARRPKAPAAANARHQRLPAEQALDQQSLQTLHRNSS